ncbi:NADPH:quinone reductase [Enterovirga sp.]|jgi:NADPH2:quinone reductase|uniref:NADPH:quinone reductase n=1 Tax=Enterovirga sp. TaxID=2026350 RepID=UPI002609F462|nr:NADPH:quinone reductase [Enterovirga sp.]MDB5590330.1 NADPH:quinone reductase and related Zn-dependent oxidoreductase [Enterovirga sp.]
MRAGWYETNGPARQVLRVGELPDPEPGPGEVLVRLAASGVNPSDVKTRAGSRPMTAPRVVPHSDGAGVIEAVGPGLSPARVGERVWIWNGQWKRPFGTAAELIALPAEQAVRLPEGTDFVDGACLGIPALTAYRALTTDGSVKGQTVLVQGGAGAVGHYAVQMAKLLGAASVLATTSSPEKAAHARAAGADAVIDRHREDVVARVRDLTGGRGVDRIVEVDAAANMRMVPSLVAQDGLCVVYGSSTSEVMSTFGPMILSGVAVRWFIVYELAPAVREEAVSRLNGWLAAGALQHAVARTFPLDEIAAAHEAVESNTVVGNVVVTMAAGRR